MLRSLLSASERLYTCLVVPRVGTAVQRWNLNITRQLHATLERKFATTDTEKLTEGSSDAAITVDEESLHMEEPRPGSLFPTAETLTMLIDGTRYNELPIIHIKSTRNNTIISVTKHTGDVVAQSSGGMEGFKNAKKGTNIAAQAAGIAAGQKALDKGMSTVRVCVRGLGPGRLPSIKGLQMAGVNIVSITDTTRINQRGPRPRKQRRL